MAPAYCLQNQGITWWSYIILALTYRKMLFACDQDDLSAMASQVVILYDR